MTVIGVIAAFQEEGRIGDAVRSLLDAGCDRVHVLDGAWLDQFGQPFGGGPLFSTDATMEEARAAGAHALAFGGFAGDAGKQSALIHHCDAEPGDIIVRIDADERLRGTLANIAGHSLIWLHNHGANDIPDVRSRWPRGDDADHPIPLFRVFKYRPDLVCERPGRWRTAQGRLEPYLIGALAAEIDAEGLAWEHPRSRAYRTLRNHEHLLDTAETAAFPILEGVWIDHYRHMAKAAAKNVYYEAMA